MKMLKNLLDFYINSSIHVSLAVCALVKITEQYFGLESNEALLYFVFFSTISGYNFVKYAGIAKLHHRSLTNNLKVIQLFSLLCFGLMLFFGFQLNKQALLWGIPFAILTVFYAVPFLGGFAKNLRNIPSIKIIIIALVWAGVTMLLPIVNADFTVDSRVVLSFVQRFLLVIVLTLPFDIRDVAFDKTSLQTIPQKIGVEQTKKLGFVVLGITLLLEFIIASNTDFRTVFLFVFSLLLVFLQRASTKQKKYYASFWVEAIPVFWFILLFLF